MKPVDIDNWNRKSAYEYFKDYEDPFFNITANLDVTALYGFCKTNGLSFSLTSLFYSLAAANDIREFRIRFAGEELVEFERIHGTQTILNDDESFSFCYYENRGDVFEFDRAGKEATEKYKALKTFDVENDRLDLIYYSVIPWISFTSFKHAARAGNRQSVPRIVFGRIFEANGRRMMPHSVEVSHAIADGIHVGRYFESLQEKFDAAR
jgi:chloramphenicol O-acetyltransferase type A